MNTSDKLLLSVSSSGSILGEHSKDKYVHKSKFIDTIDKCMRIRHSESEKYFKITDVVDERSSLNPQFFSIARVIY